jgi:hypothetical protein
MYILFNVFLLEIFGIGIIFTELTRIEMELSPGSQRVEHMVVQWGEYCPDQSRAEPHYPDQLQTPVPFTP